MGWFTKQPETPADFWKWFEENEDKLYHADAESGFIQNTLSKKLKRVHDGLVWEISAHKDQPDGAKREFIVSADGLVGVVDAVEAMCDAAPAARLPRWRIIRFRPRMAEYSEFEMRMQIDDGPPRSLRGEHLAAALASDGEHVHIDVFVEGCPVENEPGFLQMVFILLDSVLGEYDMICRVGRVRVLPTAARSTLAASRVPWSGVRDEFDRLTNTSAA